MATPAHSNRAHALLSASGAKRWLACTPSPRLEERVADESSDYAKEGTLAHEFADVALRLFAGEIDTAQADRQRHVLRSNPLYTREMEGQVAKYVDFVTEQYAEALAEDPDNALLMVEERVDFSEWVPAGFGTGDATISTGTVLRLSDLKYGKGIRVDAYENPQLMLYGLGSLRRAQTAGFQIERLELSIVQPRLDHIDTYEITTAELLWWAERTVKPNAAKAYAGEGVTIAGEHCRFCRVKGNCRAYHNRNTELAKVAFTEPALMSNEELVTVYEALPRLKEAADAVAKYLKAELLQGRSVPGYKLVHGRSNRKWSDPDEVAEVLDLLGYPEEDYLNTKVKGLKDVGELMAEDQFNDALGHLITKPPGGPTIAPESSSKPAYVAAEQAAEVFKD